MHTINLFIFIETFFMKPQETVDFHIRWSWYNISRMYNSKANEFGGTMSIGYALLNIDRDGTPSTKLGPKMGMEPRSLTRMIKLLEKNGWITKEVNNKDKRMVNLHLTEKGQKMRNKSREYVIEFNKKIYDEINIDDLETCFRVLNKVNTIIDSKNIFK
jgi:DNA-binding MarR family transcriptional regulator